MLPRVIVRMPFRNFDADRAAIDTKLNEHRKRDLNSRIRSASARAFASYSRFSSKLDGSSTIVVFFYFVLSTTGDVDLEWAAPTRLQRRHTVLIIFNEVHHLSALRMTFQRELLALMREYRPPTFLKPTGLRLVLYEARFYQIFPVSVTTRDLTSGLCDL